VRLDQAVRIGASGGTTGRPTMYFYGPADLEAHVQVVTRNIWRHGLRSGMRFTHSWPQGLYPSALGGGRSYLDIGVLEIAVGLPFSPEAAAEHLRLWEVLRPNGFMMTGSQLQLYLETAERAGIDLPALLDGGIVAFLEASCQFDAPRRRVEEAYGVRLRNIGGASDIPGFAVTDCLHHTGMHVAGDHFVIEVCDPVTGRELPKGERGTLVVTASEDATLRLWNAQTGAATTALANHDDNVFAMAFSPDGARIVAGADKNSSDNVHPGIGGIYFSGGPADANGNIPSGNGSLETSDGNIRLIAGNEILVGSGFVRTVGGGNVDIAAKTGDVNAGTKNDGYQFSRFGYAVSSAGLGGIATASGGNVSIEAGRDIVSFLPTSGAYGAEVGDVALKAGQRVLGSFLLRNGVGQIHAGTDFGSSSSPASLSLIQGEWQVTAAHDIFLNEVRNPNAAFNGNRLTTGARIAYQFDYALDAEPVIPFQAQVLHQAR
jgi:hypothetical protein